ncbi:hypothetical protein [Amycolatopsis sp.]|uniref:hypothetical protein n=1 Tax=Amycolatopsis sp. TaxID=37632 RepID=UPI002B9B1D08|nr:hypothetical protein [Amycolatopsis sp.]HVV14663.1 hypothetical protein [Amycolatopsis sp.]
MDRPFSAEALRRAAGRAGAPRRLTRIADAVLEGKLTWEEVAGGRCEHPLALTLCTPRARETVWPLLAEAEAEIRAESAPPPREEFEVVTADDEYFARFRVLRKAFDSTEIRW